MTTTSTITTSLANKQVILVTNTYLRVVELMNSFLTPQNPARYQLNKEWSKQSIANVKHPQGRRGLPEEVDKVM